MPVFSLKLRALSEFDPSIDETVTGYLKGEVPVEIAQRAILAAMQRAVTSMGPQIQDMARRIARNQAANVGFGSPEAGGA